MTYIVYAMWNIKSPHRFQDSINYVFMDFMSEDLTVQRVFDIDRK